VTWSKQKVLASGNISQGRWSLRYWRYEVLWFICYSKNTVLWFIIRTIKHVARHIS